MLTWTARKKKHGMVDRLPSNKIDWHPGAPNILRYRDGGEVRSGELVSRKVKDGRFKGKDTLESLAASVIGKEKDREIVTYCDTGTCCPTWRFMLKEVLGYKRVYLYDGSIEEWTADPNAPVELNNTGK